VRGLRKDILTEDVSLTQEELTILQDLCMGLTDKAIAMRRYLSLLGVQSKIASLADKLLGIERLKLRDSVSFEVYNIRVRLVLEAFRRGLIGIGEIAQFDAETVGWIRGRF
jgi:DNA-binding NarL/FixJ family response regulator